MSKFFNFSEIGSVRYWREMTP